MRTEMLLCFLLKIYGSINFEVDALHIWGKNSDTVKTQMIKKSKGKTGIKLWQYFFPLVYKNISEERQQLIADKHIVVNL